MITDPFSRRTYRGSRPTVAEATRTAEHIRTLILGGYSVKAAACDAGRSLNYTYRVVRDVLGLQPFWATADEIRMIHDHRKAQTRSKVA